MRPFLLVLSSPSGGGKSTIAKALLARRQDIGYSVSATTRPMRPGEADGVSYHFLTPEEFGRREAAGEFLEWAVYNGYQYGTLRAEVERVFATGRHVLLDIEVYGARQVRQRFPHSVQVFVLPPSAEVLASRLADRRTETPAVIAQRLGVAADELLAVGEYEYVIVNDDLAAAVTQVEAVLTAETCRVQRQAGLTRFTEHLRTDVAELVARLMRSERSTKES